MKGHQTFEMKEVKTGEKGVNSEEIAYNKQKNLKKIFKRTYKLVTLGKYDKSRSPWKRNREEGGLGNLKYDKKG